MILPSLNIAILGGTGNLARKSLYPALYALFLAGKLSRDTSIVAIGRSKVSEQELQHLIQKSIGPQKDISTFIKHVSYYQTSYSDHISFQQLEVRHPAEQWIFYFAVPPKVFPQAVTSIGEGFEDKTNTSLIFEKPFGESSGDAMQLMATIERYFQQEQLFLLDHYLGKLAVREILYMRLSNQLIADSLRGENIESILIEVTEDIGIEDRSGYYEHMGALKDMVQSHILQLLAITTMDVPLSQTVESVHREKAALLASLEFAEGHPCVTRGQYGTYLTEQGVAKDSQTETYIETIAYIDKQEWAHVPIIMRTGKMLGAKVARIVVSLKKLSYQPKETAPNKIIFEIQPNAGLTLTLNTTMGESSTINAITPFECIDDSCLPTHAVLILEAMAGNKYYFASYEEVKNGWRYVEMVQQYIKEHKIPLTIYTPGQPYPRHH